MDFDGLKRIYWEKQTARVLLLRDRIRERQDAIRDGRVVPDGADLSIGKGRRLKMAVMFIDICGFSQRSAETEPEQTALLAALNLFFTEMILIAEDYGGTVEKNTGDGLMAYFEDNGGEPPEVGSKRAVACALTMMAAREHLIDPILIGSGFTPFQFRVSMDYGTVTVANIGVAKGFNSYVAIGAAANFSAKMLGKAGPNEIVIGESLKNQLPQAWQAFTVAHPDPSGWIYKMTKSPYPLFKYTGRWKQVLE